MRWLRLALAALVPTGCALFSDARSEANTEVTLPARDAAAFEDATRAATDASVRKLLTDDADSGAFSLGTFADTVWDGNRLTLAAGKRVGDFVSRIFDGGDGGRWSRLRWVPIAP